MHVARALDDFWHDFAGTGHSGLVLNMVVTKIDKKIEVMVKFPGLEEGDVQIKLAGNDLRRQESPDVRK